MAITAIDKGDIVRFYEVPRTRRKARILPKDGPPDVAIRLLHEGDMHRPTQPCEVEEIEWVHIRCYLGPFEHFQLMWAMHRIRRAYQEEGRHLRGSHG